ncbi:MAG: pilus assembly protein [Acidimicrobiaceae bacterium]|nr:pilus assembly protein [Acidimicrobiaceae bacterium]
MIGRRLGSRGQATVEFALLLPVAVVALLVIAQIGLVVRARVMLTHAAREGARVAAVGGSDTEVKAVVIDSGALDPAQVTVAVTRGATTVTVLVVYVMRTNVSVVGAMLNDPQMSSVATMYREQ